MSVVTGVEDEVTLPTRRDQIQSPELTEVLRYSRRTRPHMVSKFVYGVLAVDQRPPDPQPRLHGQRLQQAYRRSEPLLRCQLIYLSVHADTVPVSEQ